MTALEAAFVTSRMLADGTLRVQFDIEPRFVKQAFELFHVPGVPAALAALKVGAGAPAPAPAPAPAAAPRARRERLAPLCEWAVLRCAEPQFQQWCRDTWETGELATVPAIVHQGDPESFAKAVICELCGVQSRKELDTQPTAAARFHELVRKPFAAWQEGAKA